MNNNETFEEVIKDLCVQVSLAVLGGTNISKFLASNPPVIDQLRAMMKGEEWIPVEERLPGRYRNVLCLTNKGQCRISCVDASGKLDDFELEVENGQEWYTHWMPLPDPINNSK